MAHFTKIIGLVLLGAGCWNRGAWGAEKTVTPRFEVRSVYDVTYRDLQAGEDATKRKNKLDLFVPKGHKDFPVVLFIHGGAWIHGDKDFMGVYSDFATSLAQRGIGMAIANYRLSPGVKHPEHIRDVARAFAWVHKHIAEYGGRPDALFLCGHSAGGHLVALLATNDAYLKAEGLSLRNIMGVIPLSGVFRIPENLRMFSAIFGEDPKNRRDASPVEHARPDAPPFLVVYADKDLSICTKPFAEAFCKAIKDKKGAVESLEIAERSHMTIIFNASLDEDPTGAAVYSFIAKLAGLKTVNAGR